MARPAKPKSGFAETQQQLAGPDTLPMLADACALIVFYLMDGESMSAQGLSAMRGRVMVSPVTVWEIARKVAAGTLPPFQGPGSGDLPEFLARRGFMIAPLSWEAAARAAALPRHHRDPMDRMLIATALTAGLPIITNDRAFAAYGVRTIW